MPSASIIELKSKEACAECGQHKLYTNDSEKNDSVVRWHCLNCNHTFFETEDQKKFRKDKEKEGKQYNSISSGVILISLTLVTILMLLMNSQQNETQAPTQPDNQFEQLN